MYNVGDRVNILIIKWIQVCMFWIIFVYKKNTHKEDTHVGKKIRRSETIDACILVIANCITIF